MAVSTGTAHRDDDLEAPRAPETSKNSPTLDVEKILDTSSELDELEVKIKDKKTEKEREELLLSTLRQLPNAADSRLLDQVKSNEKPSAEVTDYLTVAVSMLTTAAQIQGKPIDHPSDLVDAFQNDARPSVSGCANAVAFLLANPDTPTSKWFTGEGWKKCMSVKAELITVVTHIQADKPKEAIPGSPDAKDKDKGMSDTSKMLLVMGGVGVGIWALTRWLSKHDQKEAASTVGTVAEVGAVAGAAYFALGLALNNDDLRQWISKDNESWVNGGFFRGAMAFSHGEFGNMWRDWTGDKPKEEDIQKDKDLADIFGVDPDRLQSIEAMNFKDFIGGDKPSTLFNLSGQAEADEKVRGRVKSYYMDKIKTIPNYVELTMGQVLSIALTRNMLREVDPTKVGEGNKDAIAKQDADQAARLSQMEGAFENPQDGLGVLKENNVKMLEDLKTLDEHVESHWSKISWSLARFLWCDPLGAEDASDLYDEHDLTTAREQLLAGFKDGIAKDHVEFAELEKQVQGFDGFLTSHPDPSKWTTAEIQEFQSYKEQIIDVRQRLDGALSRANEAAVKELHEDREQTTAGDFLGDTGSVLVETASGLGAVLHVESQYVLDGNVPMIVLAVSQAAGVTYQVMKASGRNPAMQLLKGAQGFVEGPLTLIKIPREVARYRSAFRFTAEELVEKLMKGEMSQEELDAVLKNVDEYKGLYTKLSKKFSITDSIAASYHEKLELLLQLKKDRLKYQRQWKEFFQEGHAMQPDAEAALRTYMDKGKMDALREAFKAGEFTHAAARAEVRLGENGYEVWLDNKKLMDATEEEATKISDMIILEGSKVGKTIDKVKLAAVWKYAQPLMQIVGIADTVRIFYKLSSANTKEELQQAVAEETANVLAFVVGGAVTFKAITTVLKPTSPGSAIAVGVLSVMGGIAAGMKLDEPIKNMVEGYLKKFPNGYEVAKEAATALESFSLLTTVRLNKGLIAKGLTRAAETEVGQAVKGAATRQMERLAETEVAEKLSVRLAALAERDIVKTIAKVCGKDALKAILIKVAPEWALAGATVEIPGVDVLTAGFAAVMTLWTAKDIYDLAVLVHEGYILNEELAKRLPLKPSGVVINEPSDLKKKYGSLNGADAEVAFDELLKVDHAVFTVQREGDAGFETWSVEKGEVKSLIIKDVMGNRVAGINDEDIQKIMEAQEAMKAEPVAEAPTEGQDKAAA